MKFQLPLCGMSSNETRSIIVAPGQGVTDAPIMAAGVDCNAKMLTIFFYTTQEKEYTLNQTFALFLVYFFYCCSDATIFSSIHTVFFLNLSVNGKTKF